MERLGKAVDSLSSKYENFLIIGDFNAQASDTSVKDFCDVYSFKYLINEPTCYKSPNNLKCLDLMLINRQHSFQNSCVIDTRLSDFYKMTVTVLRSYFLKAEPKIVLYRDYKQFSNNEFRSIINTNNGNLQNSNDTSLNSFMYVCKEALDKVAPLKQKYIRANNDPFMNKDITKAIMKRTRLRNNYLKHRCDANRKAYNAQRSLCFSLERKANLDYYNKLNHKKVSDIRHFGKL